MVDDSVSTLIDRPPGLLKVCTLGPLKVPFLLAVGVSGRATRDPCVDRNMVLGIIQISRTRDIRFLLAGSLPCEGDSAGASE